jgi:hypothetical protein
MAHSVFPEVLDGIDSVLRATSYRSVLVMGVPGMSGPQDPGSVALHPGID